MQVHILETYAEKYDVNNNCSVVANYGMGPTVLTESIENSDYDDFYPVLVHERNKTETYSISEIIPFI